MIKVSYPINLYVTHKSNLVASLIMVAMIGIGFYAFTNGLQHANFIFAMLGFVSVGIGLYFLLIGLIQWFLTKPTISIQHSKVVFLTLFKPKNEISLPFNRLKSIYLEPRNGAKNLSFQWFFVLIIKMVAILKGY